MKVKGVNLGNWLVLEKWMSSELFHGTEAEDEEDFYTMLSPGRGSYEFECIGIILYRKEIFSTSEQWD